MEVVLSTGRFGDDGPAGVPFQKEEIREWSHVDRLTGMLERARVETGRWQTSIQGAAKSYGKVIDSRERNSADGSVVQRARRQVEIYQSQGAGRSVQVVRASQWSSSRVTDSTTTSSYPLSLLNKQQEIEEESSSLPRLDEGENRLSRFEEEKISERLSALIGTLKYPIASTVPLRRIDSKYSSRAPILESNKRSNSNEDLGNLSLDRTDRRDRVDELRSRFESSERSEIARRTGEVSQAMKGALSDGETNLPIAGSDEECGSRGSAIQLLPSSKSNRTFVNLMRDARVDPPEIPSTGCDRRVDDSAIFLPSQKIPKRVGFCKTEVHFVADSGKVNIVETDEKPPPTNKFRRKRRLTGIANKILPILDSAPVEPKFNKEKTIDLRNVLDDNTNHQRCHTTTVKLGTDISKNYDTGVPGQPLNGHGEENCLRGSQEAFSHGIVLRLENRIYDRLEAYSSNLPGQEVDSRSRVSDFDSATRIAKDVQTSALKSTRLVMNLTRAPIVVDPETAKISQNDKFLSSENHLQSERATEREHDGNLSSFHIEWKHDHEDRVTAIDSSDNTFTPDDNKLETGEFVANLDTSLEIEDIDENKEITAALVDDAVEKKEGLRERTKSPGRVGKSEPSTENYDVVCTDSENNHVLLKVVTTHEPTIARVESIDFSKRFQKRPGVKKKTTKIETPVKKKFPIEHTYVNIFKRSDRAPIYENYDPNSQKIEEIKDSVKNEEKKIGQGKISRVSETKRKSDLQIGGATNSSKILENTNAEPKTTNEKTKGISESSVDDKKLRERTTEEKPVIKKKSKEPSASKIAPGSSKSRASKISKSLSSSRAPSYGKSSVSSSERDFRLCNATFGKEKVPTPGKSYQRPIVSTSTAKSKETRGKPMEVVYQTAVYNMKNEKLAKPQTKAKEVRGPRYLNELICGAKTKRPSNTKSSSTIQYSSHNKGAPPTVRHWK